MDTRRLLTLKLDGSDPKQWGRQHGEVFRQQVRELADIRRGLLVARMVGWSPAQLDSLCDDQIAAMESRWPRTLAELQGIADGSGVSLRDLVVLNAYTDLKDFQPATAEEGGCSLLAAKGPKVNFAGQTWDMHASAEPYTLLLEIPGAQVPVRVLTLTGCLALSGVNDWGVSVLINDLNCAETDRRGLIWPGLVRLMLEQPRASAARRTLATNLPGSGHNYMVSDKAKAINVETTGRRCSVTGMLQSSRPGYLGHTNHYLGGLVKFERTERLSPTTEARMAALEEFFAANPIESLTAQALFEGFFESGPLCDKTCLPGNPTDPAFSKTCAGIAVDYLAKKAFAWRGRYDAAKRIEWSL